MSIADELPGISTQTDNSDIIIVAEMMFTLSTLPESEQLLVIGKVLHGVVLHSPIDQLELYVQ